MAKMKPEEMDAFVADQTLCGIWQAVWFEGADQCVLFTELWDFYIVAEQICAIMYDFGAGETFWTLKSRFSKVKLYFEALKPQNVRMRRARVHRETQNSWFPVSISKTLHNCRMEKT